MSKLAPESSKYSVYVEFDADGVVKRPDVIGAIFGQTEGLLGDEMDLRELQKTGRLGRIEVEVESENGSSSGIIEIPSSLGASETALIAASLETIKRVGPCEAELKVKKVEDVRSKKRKYLVDRAKTILNSLFEEGIPESQQLSDQIKEAVRSDEITEWNGLPAGPRIDTYDSIIVVEGRADVVNLLKKGVKNLVAIEGTHIPSAIKELSQKKTTTVFLDGDRGGDLILEELAQKGVDVDYVARAPDEKEVEELTKKEIFKSLREKIPFDQAKAELREKSNGNRNSHKKSEKQNNNGKKKKKTTKVPEDKKENFSNILNDLVGTRAAYLLDRNMEILGKVPVKDMFKAMGEVSEASTLIFDGSIDKKLVNFASQRGIKNIVGMEKNGSVEGGRVNLFIQSDFD